ncbi:hypothetical protein ACIF70_40475 [Actinacidiphila glaucinigra]|uniref:hypothetical protein n=1 Tax=Actinacidiphila glaucinigra TaxID=235986 RepID=UPI0037C56E85
MTKNGSNARKARVRALAARTGMTYRAAARAVDKNDTEHAEYLARARAYHHSPEACAEYRDSYLSQVLAADLPEPVRMCLYVLTDKLGTGTLIDPLVVVFTTQELADRTGLKPWVAERCVHLAQALGWVADYGCEGEEPRLTVPGEEIDLYKDLLADEKDPIREGAVYDRLHEQIRDHTQRNEAENRAFIERLRARDRTGSTLGRDA